MSPDSPERINTRIKTTRDRNISIIFDPGRFMDMNQAYAEEMGQSLLEVANTDPTEAYRYIRRAIGHGAAQHVMDFSDNNRVTDSAVHGLETTRAIAEELVLTIIPPEYEGPRTVRVALGQTQSDDLEEPSEPIQIMELKVEPPNLAA